MRTPSVIALATAVAFAGAPLTAQAADGDDQPIPFSDEDRVQPEGRRELPRRSDESANLRDESDYEQLEREKSLAGADDPNIGLSPELVMGLMLIDSSRGQLVETRFDWGLRLTWEWGRTFLADEDLRDALFADVTWQYTAQRDGTGIPTAACPTCASTGIYADTNYHYFTLAPAYALVLGRNSPFSVYAQLGAGLGYEFAALHVRDVETQIAGTKFLFQYGIGFRGRPAIVADGSVRVSFRVEVTRFRRGYMDDTFVGGSVGAAF